MSDLSITAANVVPGANADIEHGLSGTTVTAGQWVYQDSSTGRYLLADSNSATAAARTPRGVALNNASAGQPLAIQKGGLATIGATMTAGVAYYLSDTPGGMCPVADVGSGEYSVILGIATSATVLDVHIQASGASL